MKRLILALLNIRSITNKTFSINDLICDKKIDFLFLTETWLGSDGAALLAEATPPNYSFIHTIREGKKGGGLATILNVSI